ncbi:DUF4747 family protein [Shinella sp. AETb1-6]|uniref:DUF4747 family protein n=1 Tax=Shinella sp. AETb1-6 TaxID=2692210 RepID=UPI00136CBE5A|nr:DUF4747 family protein [Shinella sp. AETb1-6]MXN49579.1 DUF4747 family protein [Shinella sp. AETb1-6]
MAQKIKIASSILNIRLHPHSDDRYVDFFSDIYRTKKIVRLHGDRHGMMSLLDMTRSDEGIIRGIVTTFLNIEIDGNWFDTENLKEATDNQVSEVKIPENLHPNSAQFYFIFDVKRHRIYIQNYSKGKVLTPPQALKLFSEISEQIQITQKYNYPSITLVQDKKALEKIFNIERIDRITISILKPNADILVDNFEEQIEAHLLASHAKKLTLTYQANPGESLVTNDDIQKLGGAALTNGSVKVDGRDNGHAVHMSTEDSPLIIQDKYDPDTTTEDQAFRKLINEAEING